MTASLFATKTYCVIIEVLGALRDDKKEDLLQYEMTGPERLEGVGIITYEVTKELNAAAATNSPALESLCRQRNLLLTQRKGLEVWKRSITS